MTAQRTPSAWALAAAAALAACVDTSTPREGGAFWWTAAGPDELPAPVVTALLPGGAYAGDPAFVLTVTGSRFVEGAQVTWNVSPRPTTFVSPTTVRAQIAADDVATAGTAGVAVVNPGGAASGSVMFTISPDVLSIASLTPAGVDAGDPAFVLTVTGRRFVAGSVVTWNGGARATTYVSSTALRAAIAAADVASGGWVSVGVENPGGEGSSYATFTVTNPAPTITSLSPTAAPVGGGELVLTVYGGRFVSGSYVTWNGSWRPTTFVSSSELRATIPASDLPAAGTAAIRVSTPSPGGGDSAALWLPILRTSPTVTAMSPTSIAPGSGRFTLTVTGSGFVADTVVRWNGAARPTSVLSSNVLHAAIDPADVASAGTAAVSVHSAPPGGGTASAGTFTIAAPARRPPQAVAFQIDPAHSGSVDLGAAPTFPADPAWVVTVDDVASYALIAGGKAFVVIRASSTGGYGARLLALDLATGATAWGPVAISGTYYWAGHAFDAGKIFVLNFDGTLRSFDAGTGAAGWSVDLPLQYAFFSPPTAAGGTVYVTGSGSGSTLYAVAAADGQVRWTSGVGEDSSPTVGPDGLYFASSCAAEKRDLLAGALLWRTGSCSGGSSATVALGDGAAWVRFLSAPPSGVVYDGFDATFLGSFGRAYQRDPIPALAGRDAYLVAAGALEARDRAGNLRWTFAAGGALTSAPLVIGDTVVAGAATGAVVAVDAATGTERWRGDAGAPILSPSEGQVYQPVPALAAGEGHLVVPAGRRIVAWKLVP